VPGYVDLHCHLLYGVDDGARALEHSLQMAKALVELGYTDVAPSPHHRPEFAPREQALARLEEVQQALVAAGLALRLHPNAENYLFDERLFAELGTPAARLIGQGPYLLVELPYTAPVPALPELIFRMKLKGVTPLIAHPERCLEFERKGRAAEAVRAGAALQLDVGALIGRYGPIAKKVGREVLGQGLYAVAATDLHSPVGAREWVERALGELRSQVGQGAAEDLLATRPRLLLAGQTLES
jgi:protein-tyrosine phosphatase